MSGLEFVALKEEVSQSSLCLLSLNGPETLSPVLVGGDPIILLELLKLYVSSIWPRKYSLHFWAG